VIDYRTFRNTDPPALLRVWNEAFTRRGAVPLASATALEEHVLAKPYFDPAGLIVSVEGKRPVGFAHGGFGPNADGTALDRSAGVVALVAVAPAYQRRGVGSELLRRCETYLHDRGARTLDTGSTGLFNPFYQGLYGGSASPGVLDSDTAAAPFFSRHGYQPRQRYAVLQRLLTGGAGVVDARFSALRRRYELRVAPRQGALDWWRECVLGPADVIDFALEEKATGGVCARAGVWEMEGYTRRWNQAAVGLLEVDVRAGLRRQGLARFLLSATYRYLQDQYFAVVEAQVADGDEVAGKMLRGAGFQAVDTARAFRKE
jgi:ribosomal protein S18 acetylase RimI-like enzyme